ncbi:PAS domain-containing protein [Streptomyces sp. NPDC050439]|uniref:PAS domain-containing protein n=1 Tax=unclassified Streptomyces TaxID=2593676 RepID=UPI003419C894
MHEVLRATSGSPLFEVTAAPYAVLDTQLRIQGANPAYLRATGRSRDELMGVFVFDAFPDNPEDADATGVLNLGSSLERVLRHAAPHDMGVQRYDIPRADAPGTFLRKTWSPINSPLSDVEGHIVGVLHHVEDITVVDDILHQARGTGPSDVKLRPAAVLRRAMLAAARCEDQARDSDTRRDALWHRVVHAARRNRRPGGCADAVCSTVVEELPEIDAAAITVHGSGLLPQHLAVSSPLARRAEEIQWVTGEGPTLTALATGEPALMSCMDRDGPAWPFFADAARGIGVSGVFAFPLRTAAATLGTLTLYGARRTGRPAQPPAVAQEFADMATAVLLADMDSEIVEQVRATADADDINVTIGILSVAHGISTHESGLWLRAAAGARDRPLADFAREIMVRHGHKPGGRH